MRETRVSPSALIYPLFIREGQRVREPIPSLEGQYRYSSDTLLWELETLEKAGVTRVLLFGIPQEKDACGSSAWQENGVIQTALRGSEAAVSAIFLYHRRMPL